MCGIIAVRVTDDATPYLLDGLARLGHPAGVSAATAVRTVRGGTGATRSVAGVGSARPHGGCSDRISVAHDGVVANAGRLRRTLTAQGHRFRTADDGEVVAHLVGRALAVDPDLMLAVQVATAQLEGSWAVAVLDARDGRMVVAADGSPLVAARSLLGDFVASDVAAIAPWCETFVALRDGDVVELGDAWDWSSGGVAVPVPFPTPTPFAATTPGRGDHPDHMAKEIAEQPAVVASILRRVAPHTADGSAWVRLGLPGFHRLAVVACGSSRHAGEAIAAAVRGIGGVPTDVVVASEADQAVLGPSTLVLAVSRSGETAGVLRALDVLDDRYPVLALTSTPDSSLANRADAVLDTRAGAEVGIAPTKTFTAQLVVGITAMVAAMVASGRIEPARARLLVDELADLPARLVHAEQVSADRMPLLVASVARAGGFLVTARGAALPYAAEGALKLTELSSRWAEAHPVGELQHGALALVDEGTPVVVIDQGEPDTLAAVAAVRARGGFVVTIGGAGSDVPALGPRGVGSAAWGPVEAVVPLQMLARGLALRLGCAVDKQLRSTAAVSAE